MFHRIISLLLIVNVSLAVPFVFMNIACRSTQNAARIKRFLKLHIVIKPLNKKNKHNKFFIILKRNSFNVHLKFGACQKWEPAGRIGDFGNFLNGFAKSQRLIVLNIDWVQLFWKTVKYCILSEVCMINTAPHSTVSPQMWCITSIYKRLVYTRPDLLARFVKVNLSNAKNSALFVCQA